MADSIKPNVIAGRTGSSRHFAWRLKMARCRSWLRELSTQFAWMLVARHGSKNSYCPVYRSSLAVLLHGLARDVALSHLCEPVHCYAHAANMAWENKAALKRSPLLTR
jgi:hypothetical protein